jgi:hypothetical protein
MINDHHVARVLFSVCLYVHQQHHAPRNGQRLAPSAWRTTYMRTRKSQLLLVVN